MVSVVHMPVSLLVWNTLSNLYWLARVITADQVSICVVLENVSLACLNPIYHHPLSSSGDTVEWRRLDWLVLAYGTSGTLAFDSDILLDGIEMNFTQPIV